MNTVFPRKFILKNKRMILKKRIESEDEERMRGKEERKREKMRVHMYVSVNMYVCK